MFRKILGMRPKALPFLKISVRNGDSTFFWWDPWTPFGPLFTYLASDGPSLLGIPVDTTIADLQTTSGWLLPNQDQINNCSYSRTSPPFSFMRGQMEHVGQLKTYLVNPLNQRLSSMPYGLNVKGRLGHRSSGIML